jgi:hypothetical protein
LPSFLSSLSSLGVKRGMIMISFFFFVPFLYPLVLLCTVYP